MHFTQTKYSKSHRSRFASSVVKTWLTRKESWQMASVTWSWWKSETSCSSGRAGPGWTLSTGSVGWEERRTLGSSWNSAKSPSSGGETDLVSAAVGIVDPKMETRRGRPHRTVRARREAGEDPSLLDRGILKTAVMTGLSLLERKIRIIRCMV